MNRILMEPIIEKNEPPVLQLEPRKLRLPKFAQFVLGAGIWFVGYSKVTNYPQDWWGGFTCLVLAGFLLFYSFPQKTETLNFDEGDAPPPADPTNSGARELF